MYTFVSKLTHNKVTGTLSAILYITMPYHLTDMYIRNAIGEFLSYIFIPLVFLGLYKLFQKEKGDWILCVGAIGLLLTHNLMTLMTALIAFIYLCTNLSKLKDKDILKKLFINIFFIMVITAFFWMPMLETKTFTEYQVYQKDAMATAESLAESALDLKALFFTEKDATHVFEIGLHIIVILCLTVFAIKKAIKSKYKKEYILFLCLGLLCTFMSTKYFPWNLFGNVFEILQFPWRMLVFANFFFAIVCALNIEILVKNFNTKDVLFFSVISILCVILLKGFLPIDSDIVEIDKWNIGIVSENATDVIAGMGKSEYLPVKFNENRDYITHREHTVYVLDGNRNS